MKRFLPFLIIALVGLVTVGVAVLICRLAYRTFGHAAAAVTGEPLIALPGEHQVHPGTE